MPDKPPEFKKARSNEISRDNASQAITDPQEQLKACRQLWEEIADDEEDYECIRCHPCPQTEDQAWAMQQHYNAQLIEIYGPDYLKDEDEEEFAREEPDSESIDEEGQVA